MNIFEMILSWAKDRLRSLETGIEESHALAAGPDDEVDPYLETE